MLRVLFPLAWTNLKKNSTLYLPFSLMFVVVTSMLYILMSLAFDPSIRELIGGESIQTVLLLGIIILVLTGGAILLYANGFAFRQRSKEYGVYGMLGLERRHLFSLMSIELMMFSSVNLVLGLFFGITFNQLAYMIYQKLMHAEVTLQGYVSTQVVLYTLGLDILLVLLLLAVNGWKVFRIKPLQLAKEKRRGDQAGIWTWFGAVFGIVCIAIGYYMSLVINNPVAAIQQFFIAVLLVSVGTYGLFQSAIILLLKWLKGRKNYYYRPTNFISLSNLVFRMRKNAAGLATICLLSTMALVTITSGVALYLNVQQVTGRMAPHAYGVSITASNELVDVEQASTLMTTSIHQYAEKYAVPLEQVQQVRVLTLLANLSDSRIEPLSQDVGFNMPDLFIEVIDQEQYQKLTQSSVHLEENELLIYTNIENTWDDTLALGEFNGVIRQKIQQLPFVNQVPDTTSNLVSNKLLLVVSDIPTFFAKVGSINAYDMIYQGYGTSASYETQQQLVGTFSSMMDKAIIDDGNQYMNSYNKVEMEQTAYSMYGTIFFIGLILAVMFILSLSLVIYYKQISEGIEDRDRFAILQKVGLSKLAIRQTVRKQVMTVFFAPILVALAHLAAAYPMLRQILILLGVGNQEFLVAVVMGCSLAVVAIYGIVFVITSRSYEKIVSGNY